MDLVFLIAEAYRLGEPVYFLLSLYVASTFIMVGSQGTAS